MLLGQGLDRSIPACAGEPVGPIRPARYHAVYPRVCGGTPRRNTTAVAMPGLSPRVRGNQPPVPPEFLAIGSIPACAGEPVYQA